VPKILPNKELLRKAEPHLVPIVVVLVGVTAFGLGRLSAPGQGSVAEVPRLQAAAVVEASPVAEVKVQPAAATSAKPTAGVGESAGHYVASQSGSKYYLPSCSGAARIKEENRIYFASVAEARTAGYTPAANCPGL
jgi:hypothetical protein